MAKSFIKKKFKRRRKKTLYFGVCFLKEKLWHSSLKVATKWQTLQRKVNKYGAKSWHLS